MRNDAFRDNSIFFHVYIFQIYVYVCVCVYNQVNTVQNVN